MCQPNDDTIGPLTVDPDRPRPTVSAARLAETVPAERSSRHAVFALTSVCLGFFMILLDGSALNIALPAIQHDIHATMAALQWVITIYTIPLAAVLLSAGTVADRWGSKRLFCWSLVGFTVASLACALSPTLPLLVVFRAIQGIAAGGLLPTTLTIITRTYADPIARAKAITLWGATGGVALVSGPLLGGALTEFLGWRSIFLINVPVGLVTLVLAFGYVSETPRRSARSLDLLGQIVLVAALTMLVAGLIEGGALGWESPIVVTILVLAALAIGAFWIIETRSQSPMLPLRIFRRAAFSASVTNGFALQFGGYGMQFMFALFLQDHWKLSAVKTGLIFVPFGVAWVLGTIVLNRRLVGRGPRLLLWTGASASLLGSVVLLFVSGLDTWPVFILGSVLVGLGCGLFSPSLSAAAMLSVDPHYVGLGSGVLNTARQVGMALGISLLGVLIASHDIVTGMRWSMAVVALCFLAIIVLSLRFIPRKEL